MIDTEEEKDFTNDAIELDKLLDKFYSMAVCILDVQQKRAFLRIYQERMFVISSSIMAEITVIEQLIAVASRMESVADE